jgi:hypothetical protein
LARLFISRLSEMLKDLPISPLASTEGMNVDMITDIVINIDADTVRAGQWHTAYRDVEPNLMNELGHD